MNVKVWLIRKPSHVVGLVKRMGVLFDAARTDLPPGRFWQPGTYFTHSARIKAVVMVLLPAPGRDMVALGRRVAGLLEARKGLVLDWAGATRRSGIWLIVKTLATDAKTGKNREVRLDRSDLAVIRALAPGRKRAKRWRGR
ncbi:hypothetical protein Psch_03508 [Pelotomaculum schinkii]|uniref:Uncharacterized protein n=1 Tax=Pelotomaculum schinkii TaxID=78350 RepID=A0A4Y7R7K8_9FIRM|nr:hypothetical protein [Pelotomaculum schinkii]TEB04746.1 hypothetical protein Psch_03508 [Pelotomaculum schinkii]